MNSHVVDLKSLSIFPFIRRHLLTLNFFDLLFSNIYNAHDRFNTINKKPWSLMTV